jgi:hypothetical protein
MGVRFSVKNGDAELGAVETETEDDFMYFRDAIHAALETGEYGSRFPVFMNKFFAGWEPAEVAAFKRELGQIHEAFRKLPPNSPDGNWSSKAALSGRGPETLAEVYVDKDGAPLIQGLITLAGLAQSKHAGIEWGS